MIRHLCRWFWFPLLLSCDVSFNGNFENTPVGNFDFFFQELQQTYAYRDYRFENDLTLDEIENIERSNLIADPTWDNLVRVLENVIYTHIGDPHLNLVYAPTTINISDTLFYHLSLKRSNNFDTTTPRLPLPKSPFNNTYLQTTDLIDYTLLPSDDNPNSIGYLYIKHLGRKGLLDVKDQNDKIAADLDSLLKDLRDRGADRLVVDIRSPAGGSYYIAQIIASRLVSKHKAYAVFEEGAKNNPRKKTQYLAPEGFSYFQDKPIVVLINSYTCSAGELLLLMLKAGEPDRVKSLGVNTLGCPGSTLHRELPNGWIYQLTITRSYDENGKDYFKTGIAPDIPARMPIPFSGQGLLQQGMTVLRSMNSR